MNRRVFWLVVVAIISAGALTAGVWFGAHWIQLARADLLLTGANNHINRANEIMADVRLGDLDASSFNSLENIGKGAEAAGAAPEILAQAREEIKQAETNAHRARGLLLLPDWYYDYLAKKEEIARLRAQQVDRLSETAENLLGLFDSGPLIFRVNEETDRLIGRLESDLDLIPNDPINSGTDLIQVAQSLRALKKQIDDARENSDFQLLEQLSFAEGDLASLADLGAKLAVATATGDQAAAQNYSAQVSQKLSRESIGSDYPGKWWNEEIAPVQESFDRLQQGQRSLDTEAAVLYKANRD